MCDMRKPWTPKQSGMLANMVDEMMEEQGYVNFGFISATTTHSIPSCERKAYNLGLCFTKKSPSTVTINDPRAASRVADEYLRKKGVNYAQH